MRPYLEIDGITLFLGDCMQVTEWLAADVLIADPPYGMAYVSNSSKYGSTPPIAGDHDADLRDRALKAWNNGTEPRPALVFGTWRVTRPENTRHMLVWDKGDSPGMGDLTLPWGHSFEEIYVMGAGWIGSPRRSNVIRVPTMSASASYRPDHPTPKPVRLLERLISNCPPEWTIADPFAGSGSALIAARNLGRRAIGVEVEERYCEMIASQLQQSAFDFEF